jgi:hypothetical protein
VIAGLVVSQEELDLGEIWEERNFRRKLMIQNRTAGEIRVLDFELSCACLAVEPRSLRIPAEGTADVWLTVDLTKRGPWEKHQARRPLQLHVSPVLMKGKRPEQHWTLTGFVLSRVTLDTQSLHFGERPVHGRPGGPQKVRALVHIPFRSLEARVVPPSAATVEVQPHETEEAGFVISVRPSPSLPLGPFQGELAFDIISPEGERLPAGVYLPVVGEVQPEVRVIPSQLLFGPRVIGETAEATVVLQVLAGSGWVIERIEVESAEVVVERLKEMEETPPAFRVTQRVSKEGDHTSSVRLLVRKGDGAHISLPMTVSYYGRTPGRRSPPGPSEAP